MFDEGGDKDICNEHEQDREILLIMKEMYVHVWDMTLAQAQDCLTKRVHRQYKRDRHRLVQEIVDTLVWEMMNERNYWKDNEYDGSLY